MWCGRVMGVRFHNIPISYFSYSSTHMFPDYIFIAKHTVQTNRLPAIIRFNIRSVYAKIQNKRNSAINAFD